MSTEILEAELVPDEKLVKYAGQTGLEKPATETLVLAFAPVFAKARTALAGAAGVAASVKDATCVTEIRKSRACRLAIRAVRLEGEAVHKKQKESALRFGKAVDGFKNILLADLEPVEKALADAEDTAERAESARKAALKATREAELLPLLESPPLADLGALSEEHYAKTLADARFLRQAKIDAAAKVEADRLAKAKADAEERARIEAENARLKVEAEAREAAAKAERAEAARVAAEIKAKADADAKAAAAKAAQERAEAEAKAKAEREAIEAKARVAAEAAAREAAKLKAELAEKAEAEARAKAKAEAEAKATALATRKAAAAPDKAKLLTLADTIAEMELPTFGDEALADAVRAEVRKLASWLAEQAVRLS